MERNLNDVNVDALAPIISKMTGYYVEFSVAIAVNRRTGESSLQVESQELRQCAGIMADSYETLKLHNFGGCLSKDGTSYWMPIAFGWGYKKGGSNGHGFCTAYWSFVEKKWTIV